MQKLRIILVLITLGCILGPIGTVVVMYRDNLTGMVLTPQLQQLFHFDNNNNSDNNENNYDNGYNNNPGNSDINNSPVNSIGNNFGGSGVFAVTLNDGSSTSGEINANINCIVTQNGNNIQLNMDINPANVPDNLQSSFISGSGISLIFDGTSSNIESGIHVTASAQGKLNSFNTYCLNLDGTIDQSQNTLTFTISSVQGLQLSVNTPQEIFLHSNSNFNDNNGNNNYHGNDTSNNNRNNIGSPTFVSGQISTSQKTITLTFSLTNGLTQDTTINSVSGTVEVSSTQYSLGTVNLNTPLTIHSGQTATLTVTGTLTQDGLNYLNNNYNHTDQLDVMVVDGVLTQDGVTYQGGQSQALGNVAVNW